MEGLDWNGTVIRSEEVEVFRTDRKIRSEDLEGRWTFFVKEKSKIGELGFCDLMESFLREWYYKVIEILQGDTWNLAYEELELIIVS